MKKTGFILISSMLLLMNSCSETSPLEPNGFSDEAAVRFTTTMQPTVELTRAMGGMLDQLPISNKATGDYRVGIYGVRIHQDELEEDFRVEGSTDEMPVYNTVWNNKSTYHRSMKNKQYYIEENHTLSGVYGEEFYPLGSDSTLAVYAYCPYYMYATTDGKLDVDLTKQYDILYTGQVLANTKNETLNPVKLPFKHALGAVAFRFYTVDGEEASNLEATIVLSLNYGTDYGPVVRMNIADGTFEKMEDDKGVYFYSCSLNGVTVHQVTDEADRSRLEPIGHLMLPPGENFKIASIQITMNDKTTSHSFNNGNGLALEAGKTTVISFKQVQEISHSNLLQMDETRAASTSEYITFEIEEDYIE